MMSGTFEHRIVRLSPRHHQGSPPFERSWAMMLLVLVLALAMTAYRATVNAPPRVSAINEALPAGLVTSFGARHSHNRRYTAEIGDASPVAIDTAQSWTLHLSRRGRRVSHATVAATAWMPDDTVRSPVTPSVRYVGGGDYRIDGLSFTKAGWWNVALVIDGKQGRDSVAFNVVIPRAR
jgi:hypothetical protein